jgi:hypothetical protein
VHAVVTDASGKTMKRTASAVLCSVLGLLTIGTGVYFAALRPAMLPEDQRLTSVSIASLPPAYAGWLSIVFRTWGGFMIAFGVLLLACGIYLQTRTSLWLRGGIALSVIVAFGMFLVSNLQIRSDFLWYIVSLFMLAALAAVATLRRGV